jgi:hypothetical protein
MQDLWTLSLQVDNVHESISKCSMAKLSFRINGISVHNVNLMTMRYQYASVIQYQTINVISLHKLF